MTSVRLQHLTIILDQRVGIAVHRAQWRAQVVADRIGESVQFLIRVAQARGAFADLLLEILAVAQQRVGGSVLKQSIDAEQRAQERKEAGHRSCDRGQASLARFLGNACGKQCLLGVDECGGERLEPFGQALPAIGAHDAQGRFQAGLSQRDGFGQFIQLGVEDRSHPAQPRALV